MLPHKRQLSDFFDGLPGQISCQISKKGPLLCRQGPILLDALNDVRINVFHIFFRIDYDI